MGHRVHLSGLEDLDHQRVADVGSDELQPVEVDAGLPEVHADEVLDLGVVLESARQPTREVPGDPGDQDPLAHGRP